MNVIMHTIDWHVNKHAYYLFWSLILIFTGCGSSYDPSNDVFTGSEARQRIDKSLPDSARDFYVFDGGSFNGSIYYVSFTCDTVEDCWAAVTELGAPDIDEFQPQIKSEYAVNIHGPAFYWPSLKTDRWRISTDANGATCEEAQGDRQMNFWAIDFDKKRVFFHRESGGFPTDQP